MCYPNEKVKKKVSESPLSPGVYIYRNTKEEILYIGKAVNLRNRSKSYFQNFKKLDPKVKVMVEQIEDVEYLVTDSDVEALLLETNLIKKYKPKYNRMMKDDKSYIWVMIPKGEDFPRLQIVREQKVKNADYFGPYPETMPVRRILKKMRHIFPYRSCTRKIQEVEVDGKKRVKSSNPEPCLYYYMGQCNAPCAGKISKKEYGKGISDIRRFFRGEKGVIVERLKGEMIEFSDQRRFEKAAFVRDRIQDINYVTQKIRIRKDMDEDLLKKEKGKLQLKAVEQLLEKLKIEGLNMKSKFKVETYDISNIQGTNATGSMIVFVDGKSEKSLYRKFKIKTKSTPDDFEMMREVFKRRFNRKNKKEDKSFDVLPGLLVVDGGKGQLSATYHILQDLEIDVPIIGLAKREEEVFKIVEKEGELEFKKIRLPRRSDALYLLQKVRDEAHRFALGYHRKLRGRAQIKSRLDDIPGVGNITKKKLLKAFGSTENIKKAKESDLLTVIRSKKTVKNLKKLL